MITQQQAIEALNATKLTSTEQMRNWYVLRQYIEQTEERDFKLYHKAQAYDYAVKHGGCLNRQARWKD